MTICAWSFAAVQRGLEEFGAWAWRASWQGAVLAAVVAVLLLVAGKRISPGWRFGLWGFVLVRLAMPVVVEVEWWGARDAEEKVARNALVTVPIVVKNSEMPVTVPDRDRVTLPHVSSGVVESTHRTSSTGFGKEDVVGFSLQNVWDGARRYFIWGWIAGMLFLIMRIVWSSYRLARSVARMPKIDDPFVLEAMRNCCRELELGHVVEARELPGNGAPALVGFVRPVILLPAHVMRSMEGDELRLILLHELAHVRRRDVLVNWIATLICVLHWFNPAAWLVAWRMRVERELACDELVLRVGRDAGGRAYAKTILKLVEALSGGDWRGRVPAAVANGAVGILETRAQIQRRLLMIARYDGKSRRWPVVAAGLALLVGALALSGGARAADNKTTDKGGGASAPAAGVAEKAKGHDDAKSHDDAKDRAAAKSAAEFLTGSLKTGSGGDDKASAKTAEKLRTPIADVNFNGQGLGDVVDYFRDRTGVDFLVEWIELEQAGVTRDYPITLRLHTPTPADAVLSLMFRASGSQLQYEIDKGVVVIGPTRQRTSTIMRVYDVGNLLSEEKRTTAAPVGPRPGFGGGDAGAGGGAAPVGGGGGGVGANASEVEQLINLITTTVQPEGWAQNGGPATIAVFKTKLVVKAPETIHKDIMSLLESLHDQPSGKK